MKLTPEMKEIALRVAKELPLDKRFSVEQICGEFSERFLTTLLAELSKDAEPVAEYVGASVIQVLADYIEPGAKLFTHQIPANTAEIEQRVAEACAKFVSQGARDLEKDYGHDDCGALSFGAGQHAEAKMGRYTELMELAESLENGKWREFL